jgi:transposase
MEAGTHSIWISEQLQELGHEVIVANVRELRAISHSDRESDQVDAEKLARYARLDPQILRPIAHRTVEQQEALPLIRARDLLVRLDVTETHREVRVLALVAISKQGEIRRQLAPISAKHCQEAREQIAIRWPEQSLRLSRGEPRLGKCRS